MISCFAIYSGLPADVLRWYHQCMYLPISPSLLIVSVVAIIAILLYLREYFLRKKVFTDAQKISLETRQKSQQLLHAAELAESDVLAGGKVAVLKLESDYKLALDQLLSDSTKTITGAQNQLIVFMEDLQKRSDQFEQASRKSGEQRINELFGNLEQRLSDFLIVAEQKTTTSIELELKAARQLIDTYKEQQLKLIAENVIAMMEQTLNLVLAKKLSIKDQLDLIYEALEKAKAEKFVI